MATKTKLPSDRSRKLLWSVMLVLCFVIYALYNMPGGNKNALIPSADNNASSTDAKNTALSGSSDDSTVGGGDKLNNDEAPANTAPLESIAQVSKDYSSPFKPFNIQQWTNPNGARVLFVPAPEIPMLDIRMIFDAGAARDERLPGLAGMVNGMLEEGSENYTVEEIAQGFEGLGAKFGASSHRDMAVIQLRTLSDPRWREPAVALLTEVVARPVFPQNDFERIRKLALLGLKYKEQSPEAKIADALFETLYSNHNYGILPDGTPESLNAMQLEDLRKFHKKYYTRKNLVLAIVGNIDRVQAEKLATQITAPLPIGEAADNLATATPLQENERLHLDHPSSQTHIRVATHGIKRGDPDHFALYLGNEILGGGGFSSLLNEEIRQKRGLAYSVYSYFSPMRSEGPFVIGLQTKSDSTDEALKVINESLSAFLNNGPSEQQLQEAKRSVINSFPLKMGSNGQIVGQLGAIGFYNLPLDYLEHYITKIRAVTAEEVKAAMKRHINLNQVLTLTVGKSSHSNE